VVLVGRVLPVRYSAHELATTSARAIGAVAVLSIGVAAERTGVTVERWARSAGGERADATGQVWSRSTGPDRRLPCDADALAQALGGDVSDDAGPYVCNALAWHLAGELGLPFAFVHVPLAGGDLGRFRLASRRLAETAAYGVLS
jgi:pyrrolidone-carboxylate peptidase